VTEALEEQLRGRQLKGELWALYRDSTAGKGRRCTGELVESGRAGELAEPFDFRPAVERLFHTRAILWGVENPTPPKLWLPVLAGEAPPAPATASPAEAERASPEKLRELWQQLRARGGAAASSPNRNGRR
jgi:hypothetical protein